MILVYTCLGRYDVGNGWPQTRTIKVQNSCSCASFWDSADVQVEVFYNNCEEDLSCTFVTLLCCRDFSS